ncbi:myocardin-related transcription factor B-like isoform X1 [Oncorhynchus keta]|uniref:myocardin-related transcription factor B-like isoform X1 n=2 Tax=Oncorhynchus keta TaxID=8018 RepID=UPI00227C6D52|nr:myocardin-related transcription factor B-like isoform X1 [Oncorhynchus keta]XP_052374800.1 myocardin-related transcription factor B-like isoform X1 [Oncorhynchus keta]XP_052374801.1 myocardin-related transcription factor B-like isoform X1 [Oncorhynchus keta]
MEAQAGEEPGPSCSPPASPDSAPSPHSEAVTNELQELSLQPAPNLLPLRDRKNVLQLKLQQRRTREELVSQGIMPPLKSPAAFHEQRRSLERARTEDYLKRKIRSRPERSELVRMHILEDHVPDGCWLANPLCAVCSETSVEPSLQAKQLQLKRARLADDLNDKISHRPGPMELIHKNILPVHSSIKQAIIETDFPKVAGEISSFDEDSNDTLSPEQPIGQESPLGHGPLPSPPDALACNSTPTQFLTQVPPPPPPLPPFHGPCQPVKLSNGTAVLRTGPALIKSQPKPTSERPPQRSKKPKDNKPKVRKLKYHQYIPPDQKADHEPPPQLDSTYAKILHQQQLFLQLQILNQQQQHYNYHTILPAPPKPLTDQPPPTNGPSPSPAVPAPSTSSSSQSAPSRQNVTHVGGATPGSLPPNLDDLKVAELKHELKLRSLPVSGTKNDLIERLRNYQAQQNSRGGGSATTTTAGGATGSGAGAPKTNHPTQQKQLLLQQQQLSQHQALSSVVHQSGEAGVVTLATFPFMTTAPQQIMHFGSTSSSPPVSPAPSDRSLAGMSPDETSCNGDSFGEMVSSPLTQLSLHPSPQHRGTIKEELSSSAPTACQFSMAALQKRLQVAPPSVNKDQMLQEKDKQIEALTCMLRQKQRLVETLRVQLEQGKRGGRDAPPEPLGLVRVKEEPPDIPSIPSTFCPIARSLTPSQCHMEVTKMTIKQEVGDVEEAVEPSLEAPPQQVQLEQIQAQQRSQLEQLKLQQMQQINALQLAQQQALQQLLLQQNQQNLQKHRSQQRKKKSHKQQLKQQQQQLLSQQQQQIQSKNQHQQILQAQQQQQQLKSQQASQMFLNQQSRSTTSFPLDLLKTHSTPTLVTDSNGNHFLIALTNHCAESQGSETPQGTPQGKASNHIILQRLQSTPTKLPSQSPLQLSSSDNQSKLKTQPGLVKQPTRKGQKVGLQVSTNHSPGVALSFSAPPNLQPFFPNDDSSPSEKDASPSPPAQTEDLSPGLDHEPLFSPPSPKQTPSPNPPDDKDNGSTQHMDDLFDILIQTGEISATFKPAPDPSLARLRPNTPSPSRSQAPSPLQLQLHFSPPTPPEPETPKPSPGEEELQVPATIDQDVSNTGSGRLEDFLESTTGKPLLGVEPGGPLTLIDDLHSQMLSTPSILDHTSSPMDTYDLSGYTANPPGLSFGDHALDSMDWLDITMGGASNEIAGLAPLGPLGPHTPPSVFSADFLDSPDLQLHWDSCL